MPRRMTIDVVQAIILYHKRGRKGGWIAERVGVSRATVSHVIADQQVYLSRQDPEQDCGGPEPDGPKSRCRTCGGMVVMPCHSCRVRAIDAMDSVNLQPAPDEPQIAPFATRTRPGTRAKRIVLAWRAARGFHVFHPDDATEAAPFLLPVRPVSDLCRAA